MTVTKLFDDGTMSALYKAGFIGIKAFHYRDIYLWVDLQMKVKGITKRKAAALAEVHFDCGSATVWRALKAFGE